MKIKLLSAVIAVCSFALIITACKKDNSTSTSSTDVTTELNAQANDQNQVSTESDAATNDANTAISNYSSISGRVEGAGICDADIVVDSTSDPKTITINYNGSNCLGNRIRNGSIVITMPLHMHWKDAGASITVTFHNLKITRNRDNKSITINGSKTITNVTGGLLKDLATLHTITHSITSNNMTITFDNNTERSWNESIQRTFTYNNGIVISETGTHTDGTNTQIADWGTNRYGDSFSTTINNALVVRQDCNWRLTAGMVTHVVPKATATATFGLDVTGNPVVCPSGDYFMKLTWTPTGGSTKTVILPY